MASALITFYGKTDGSSTTGDFSLDSPILHSTVTYVRIPKGMKAKVWCKRISGEVATDVIISYTDDVTVSSPTWKELSHERLASPGELILEKRRPVVILGRTGKEAFKVSWSQPSAGNAYVEIEVELTDE